MNKYFTKPCISGFFLLVSMLFFYSLFWNKIFAPNVEGWFEYYAVQINKGKVPYKDFYLFTTPLFPYVLSFLFKIFGTYFIISHGMGVITNLLCVGLMYGVSRLLKINAIISASVCAVAAVIYSVDTGEPTNYYNHLAVLFLIVSGYFFIKNTLIQEKNSYIFLIGFFAILSFMTKQTIGAIWCLATVFLLLYRYICIEKISNGSIFNKRWFIKFVFGVLGYVLPLLIIISIMHFKGMLGDFVEQVFIKGPSSKGSLHQVFYRPIWNALFGDKSISYAFYSAAIVSILSFTYIYSRNKNFKFLSYGFAFILVLLFIKAGLDFTAVSDRFLFRFFIYVGVIHSLFVIVYYLINYKENKTASNRHMPSLIISLMALSVWFSLGMSYPVYEPMAMTTICAPIFNSLFFIKNNEPHEETNPRSVNYLHGLELSTIIISALIIYSASVFKYLNPWSWSGWSEPSVGLSTEKSKLPELRGLRLPLSTVDVIDSITASIEKYSKSDSDVYMYPFFPSLYLLSHKDAYVFAYSAFIDVAPDYAIERDLEILKTRRPRVLVKLDYPRSWIQGLEGGFREGHHSAQSELFDYLSELAKSYKVVEQKRIMGDVWLRVYVKTDE